MRRSLLHYTRILILPLLTVGLVLTGCDSTGSNGSNGSNDSNGSSSGVSMTDDSYPDPSDGAGYQEETAVNLQGDGLGLRFPNNPSSSTLKAIYNGTEGGTTPIKRIPGSVTASADTYGELEVVVDLQEKISKKDLLASENLDPADSPNSGTRQNADELISFYIDEAKGISSNGVDFGQFSSKGVASALSYADAARILRDFADDGTYSGSEGQEAAWNSAFGYFGAPHSFDEFFDVTANGAGGFPNGRLQNADGGEDVDIYSEVVNLWAGYAAERAAAAEATGNPNNFAARAFNAFVDGRQAIDEGNNPDTEDAEQALQAWEETVAVNVIHYINNIEVKLGRVDDGTTTVEDGDVPKVSWAEAKSFLWTLQFESDFSDSELETLHDQLGNDPPFGELTVEEYEEDLENATQTIADEYGFADANVSAW